MPEGRCEQRPALRLAGQFAPAAQPERQPVAHGLGRPVCGFVGRELHFIIQFAFVGRQTNRQ
jgi:hypothetical protein